MKIIVLDSHQTDLRENFTAIIDLHKS